MGDVVCLPFWWRIWHYAVLFASDAVLYRYAGRRNFFSVAPFSTKDMGGANIPTAKRNTGVRHCDALITANAPATPARVHG